MKNETLHSEIAWNALMRELRSTKPESSTRKKRRARFDQQDMSAAGGVQERKVRCLRNNKTFSKDELLNSNTFLDLSPPSKSLDATASFTFGRHYKSISLASMANISCGCSSGSSSKFDVFSTYRCPCKSRSSTPFKQQTSKKSAVSSSSKKTRAVKDAIWC